MVQFSTLLCPIGRQQKSSSPTPAPFVLASQSCFRPAAVYRYTGWKASYPPDTARWLVQAAHRHFLAEQQYFPDALKPVQSLDFQVQSFLFLLYIIDRTVQAAVHYFNFDRTASFHLIDLLKQLLILRIG